ncbi:BlaI/MecI/CopY family transcriptional regulator [uncultured Paludibaculum sp.]|uniref:BlaI/MecI/CopY family transcriptional regulator n=1 Tax=uncultured Paludibaculum sp. TaxID=1765020 RepID=UPI002AAA84A0|nr:BlaI/MecI/CopY family transcriptional regulator [uncultured Paludibaculum sp.]
MRNSKTTRKNLSGLEQLVMDFLWARGPASAEQVREALNDTHPMKDATARTILRRLEEKGYATHREEGRTYIYSGAEQPQNVAMGAIRQIIDRFWGGSAEALVAGMVEQEVIDPAELRALAAKLERGSQKKEK